MSYFTHAPNLPRHGTTIVVVDVQEKLAGAMAPEVGEKTIANTRRLLSAAQILGLPAVVTEQYSKGLGPTVPQLREALSEGVMPIEKLAFNCVEAEGFMERLRDLGTRQVILAGLEAHICILQTAVGLIQSGIQVWVAEDAICSRTKSNWRAAIRLISQAGAIVAPTESILFYVVSHAGTPEFKEINKLIK